MKDAYVHVTKIKKWDICAGDAILRALGGKLTDLDGKEVDYRDVKLQYMAHDTLYTMRLETLDKLSMVYINQPF